jgi:hypothetical protein
VREALDRQLVTTVTLLQRVIVSGPPTPALRKGEDREVPCPFVDDEMGLAVEGQGRI